MSDWICPDCETENTSEDETCMAGCDTQRPEQEVAEDLDDAYHHIKVGKVLSSEAINDTLKKLSIDVGKATGPVTIVTNAPNAHEGRHVVVALPGAEPEGVPGPIKKATVGGVPSEGMLCNPSMLNWSGGGATGAALVPATEAYSPGCRPPDSRPRMA